MRSIIRIIIADDQKVFRQGLISLFLKEKHISIVGEAENGLELLNLLEKENIKPHVVLLDLEMPVMNGNTALGLVKEKFSSIKIIMLTQFADNSLMMDYKIKGADAYINKNTDFKILLETIKNVHYLPGYSNIQKSIIPRFTKREQQIIPLILAGKTNKQIGNDLSISEKSVETCRLRLYEKTGTGNAAQFSNYCTREGLTYLGLQS